MTMAPPEANARDGTSPQQEETTLSDLILSSQESLVEIPVDDESSRSTTLANPPPTRLYLAYHDDMLKHAPLDWQPPSQWASNHQEFLSLPYTPENPERLIRVHRALVQMQERLGGGNGTRLVPLSCPLASQDTILLCHSLPYYNDLYDTTTLSRDSLKKKSQVDDDIYYCKDTFRAARLACGGVVACVDAVTSPQSATTRAMALVRPPGHHACQEQASGEWRKREMMCVSYL